MRKPLTRALPTLVGHLHLIHLLFSGLRGRGKVEPPSPDKRLAAMLFIARSVAPNQPRSPLPRRERTKVRVRL
jgi:hypothetical protein